MNTDGLTKAIGDRASKYLDLSLGSQDFRHTAMPIERFELERGKDPRSSAAHSGQMMPSIRVRRRLG